MCDEVADDSLAALNFIPDWFVTSKMIKNSVLLCKQTKIYPILMNIRVIFCNKMGSLNLDLNNVNLDSNFDECDPDTIISVRILLGILNLKNTKLFLKKISE